MALWDSSDLVRRTKLRLARPASDEAFTVTTTDDVYYDFATEAQDRVNGLLAIYVPEALWTVPTELSTDDSGETYHFGTDTDSEAIFASGQFTLYENEESIPDYPLVAGVDFTVEHTQGADKGTLIRIPGNIARTFTNGGPMARYVAPSNVITSSTQPTIPKFARKPMIADMARQGFARLGLDSSDAEQEFQRDWLDVLAKVRTQAFGKYGKTTRHRPRRFWRG